MNIYVQKAEQRQRGRIKDQKLLRALKKQEAVVIHEPLRPERTWNIRSFLAVVI